MTDDTNTKLPMACACGEERKAKLLDKRRDLMIKLDPEGFYSADYWASHFTTILIFSFQINFATWYDLDYIHADQWAAVGVKSRDERISLEADTVEDALVAIWLYLYDTYGLSEE